MESESATGPAAGGDARTPLARLTPFSWRGEMLFVCAMMLASFLVAGFWYPYWRIADMDFWVIYNGFLLNAGMAQEFFDHPGYLSILLLSEWMHALHALGLLKIDALTQLPPVADAAAFKAAWTEATRAGRVLSLISAMGFVLAFGALLRALVREWRVAALGLFFLAFSGGMAMQMRIMRTELLACGLFYCGLLILMIAARRGPDPVRPALAAAAALLMTLALLNKIQMLFVIAALPVLLAPFGPDKVQCTFWKRSPAALACAGLSALAAAAAIWAAHGLIGFGLASYATATMSLPHLALGAATYWTLIALWLGFGMITYVVVWRVPPLEALTVTCAIVVGIMVGLLALYLRYQPNDVMVVFHPIEQMYVWGASTAPQLANGGLADRLIYLLDALGGLLARRTFFLSSSPRPTIFLEWFVIAATIYAWRRGERRGVWQVCALMATVYGVDMLGMARGLKQEYFLLTDPLVIIAGALLLIRVPSLQTHRWAYPVGVALIAVHVVISQAEPVKHIFRTDGPEVLCGLYDHAPKVEHLPVCGTLPRR
jgi:hypothetical protein